MEQTLVACLECQLAIQLFPVLDYLLNAQDAHVCMVTNHLPLSYFILAIQQSRPTQETLNLQADIQDQ